MYVYIHIFIDINLNIYIYIYIYIYFMYIYIYLYNFVCQVLMSKYIYKKLRHLFTKKFLPNLQRLNKITKHVKNINLKTN